MFTVREIMTDYKDFLDEGIYNIQTGKYAEALDSISKSIELKGDWEISFFYRAVANQALENFDEAVLDYTKALQINPKMTDAYYNRAQITLTRKDNKTPDLNQIIEDLNKALELDPKFIDALFAMAATLKKQEKYNEALEYLEKLLEIEPEAVQARALKKLLLQKYIN